MFLAAITDVQNEDTHLRFFLPLLLSLLFPNSKRIIWLMVTSYLAAIEDKRKEPAGRRVETGSQPAKQSSE